MKKLLVLFTMLIITATLFARGASNYVTTDEGTFFFKKVKYGMKCCLIGIKDNGEKVKFRKDEIINFSINGDVFEKMPVYKNNVQTGETEFMEVLSYRHGLKLYEYEYTSKKTGEKARRYYVYKKGQYLLEIDDKNKESITAYFNSI
jgi:uncharacterized pyridoxamine 5'-phosphate oxidase family protein